MCFYCLKLILFCILFRWLKLRNGTQALFKRNDDNAKKFKKKVKQIADNIDNRRKAKFRFGNTGSSAINVVHNGINTNNTKNKPTPMTQAIVKSGKKELVKNAKADRWFRLKQNEYFVQRKENKQMVTALSALSTTAEDKQVIQEIATFIYMHIQ